MTDEHCISCGRNTAAGTKLFSGRAPGRDTMTHALGYLCEACQPGSALVPEDQSIPLSGRYVVIDIPNLTHG